MRNAVPWQCGAALCCTKIPRKNNKKRLILKNKSKRQRGYPHKQERRRGTENIVPQNSDEYYRCKTQTHEGHRG